MSVYWKLLINYVYMVCAQGVDGVSAKLIKYAKGSKLLKK